MGDKRCGLAKKIQETPETRGLGVIGLVSKEQFCPSSVLPWWVRSYIRSKSQGVVFHWDPCALDS